MYGDVADPEQGEIYEDVATSGTLPQGNFVPPYIPHMDAAADTGKPKKQLLFLTLSIFI